MLELKNEQGFSMENMRAIYELIRRETEDAWFFEKGWSGFKNASAEINQVFADLYVEIEFHSVPAVRCSNVQKLFERLEEIHGREISHVNLSLDDGKGMCGIISVKHMFVIRPMYCIVCVLCVYYTVSCLLCAACLLHESHLCIMRMTGVIDVLIMYASMCIAHVRYVYYVCIVCVSCVYFVRVRCELCVIYCANYVCIMYALNAYVLCV